MAESPMVGARIPLDWYQQIQEIAQSSGCKESVIVRNAIGQYLDKTNPSDIKGAIADLEDRMARVERRLRSWT